MVKRICFLVNYNLYESKRVFTKKLSEALKKLGVETLIIDLAERPFEMETAANIEEFDPDLTCSFNAIAPLSSGKFFWDYLKIPHLSLLLDPVEYSLALTNSPYSIISCVDRSDVKELHTMGFERAFFLPHATEEGAINEGERQYDLVFIGSCYDPEGIRASWKERYSKNIIASLESAVSMMLSPSMLSLREVMDTVFKEKPEQYDQLFYDLDYYSRGIDRINLIKSIKDYPMHVFGDLMIDDERMKNDWRYYLEDQPNITVHAGVNYSTALEILNMSKICLNSIPCFKNGSHERVFNSFAKGALPITNRSTYFQECFAEGREIGFYTPGDWNQVNHLVDDFLRHEEKRKAAVSLGREKTLRYHTWEARAQELLNILRD